MEFGDAAGRGAEKSPISGGSEGLELLLLFSKAPVPRLPSIYCVPLSRAGSSLFYLGTRWHSWSLSQQSFRIAWGRRAVFGLSASLSPLLGGLRAVMQLRFFSFEEQQEEQTRSPRLCCRTEGPDNCHLSSPPCPPTPTCHPLPFCPGETGASPAWGWVPSGHAVKETAGQMHGWAPCVSLLWNGSFALLWC